jgi:hypothetical protein
LPHSRPTLLLALLTAAAFLTFLGRRDIVTSHEARVVQTARKMSAAGWPWHATRATVPAVRLVNRADLDNALRLDPDPNAPPLKVNPWLIPVLNDEIRLQKPPLPYWCAAVLFKLFNQDWHPATARLIPAILGALATLLIYHLARQTLGRRFEIPAAFVWISTYFIPDEYRHAMADPYLAFFSLLGLWAWIRVSIPAASSGQALRRPSSILVFYMAIALGFLAKGPIIFIHLAIPITLYHLLKKRHPPTSIRLHLLGIAIFAAITLPWPLYVLRHIPNAKDVWWYESAGEIAGNEENTRPWWFYLPQLFLISLPWTPLLFLALPRRRVGRTFLSALTRPSAFPLLWYALAILAFSIVQQKKNAYLLPAAPAQTLLIAQGLVALAALLRLRKKIYRRRFNDALAITTTLLVIALIAVMNIVRTRQDNARSPREICQVLRALLDKNPNAAIVPAKLPPEAALYLPLDLKQNPDATTVLYLLDDPKNKYPTDLPAFAARLPDMNLVSVTRITASSDSRYKLFALTRLPGRRRVLVVASACPDLQISFAHSFSFEEDNPQAARQTTTRRPRRCKGP